MIDWTRIEELKAEFGSDDFQEIVDVFLREVEDALSDLAAHHPTDVQQARLHFVKGGAMNIGFRDLALLCTWAGSELADRPSSKVDVGRLKSAFAQSKTALHAGRVK